MLDCSHPSLISGYILSLVASYGVEDTVILFLLCMKFGPGVKLPGRSVNHPPLFSAGVKERVELYLYSPCGPSWPVLGGNLPFYLLIDSSLLLPSFCSINYCHCKAAYGFS